jgi:hypothetical protein
MRLSPDQIAAWMAGLEARQLQDLTFSEVSRALRALSSTYVERRTKLREGAALSGTGKRAAFALFYGPLHFLLVQHIVSAMGEPFTTADSLLDLGCGTGASGAGWAAACSRAPRVTGVDRHPWAVDEARWTYAALGLDGSARVGDLARHPPERRRHAAVLLAFAVNELADEATRASVLDRLIAFGASGGRVLVVEPLAGFVAPWWRDWQQAFQRAGGSAREWRVRLERPAIVAKLDRAAGLDHRELKGRSLSL